MHSGCIMERVPFAWVAVRTWSSLQKRCRHTANRRKTPCIGILCEGQRLYRKRENNLILVNSKKSILVLSSPLFLISARFWVWSAQTLRVRAQLQWKYTRPGRRQFGTAQTCASVIVLEGKSLLVTVTWRVEYRLFSRIAEKWMIGIRKSPRGYHSRENYHLEHHFLGGTR